MLNYHVVYSARRSIGINVSPGKGITVRAPYGTNLRTIQKIVDSKSDWINKHLKKNQDIIRLNDCDIHLDGSILLYRGKEYSLRLKKSEANKFAIAGTDIILSALSPENSSMVRALINRWYKSEASVILRLKMEELLRKYENYRFSPSELAVKKMKRRWGSCTLRGKITLNSELIKLDDIYTEYVLLHELCHLHHPNHGSEFYRLLGEVFPDWKKVRKELGNYMC